MWCKSCRENGWSESRDYPGVCTRCAAVVKARRARELEDAAPNGGRAKFNEHSDDGETNHLYFATKADAEAYYARTGADRGPRESKKHPGMWYLSYAR